MTGFSIFPKDNPQQAHRLKRYFIAVLTSLLVLISWALCILPATWNCAACKRVL